MAASRPVRIARSAGPAPRRASLTPGDWRPNRAGTTRAFRLFLLFSAVLAGLYAMFVSLTLSRSGPAFSGEADAFAAFTTVALLFGVLGWWVTLGRAPRGVRSTPTETVVVERMGQTRRYPSEAVRSARVVARYPRSLLSAAPTEVIEIRAPSRSPRSYLLEAGLLAGLAP